MNYFSWLVNTLPTIGKERTDITLSDYSIKAPDGLWSDGSVSLTTMGSDGATIEEYSYIDKTLIDTWMSGNVTTPGWYVRSSIYETPIPADNVKIGFTEGLSMMTDGCGASLVFSGEVANDKPGVVIPLIYDDDSHYFTWAGNSSPVRRQLKEISVTSPAGLWSDGSVSLTTMGSDGATIEEYSYIDKTLIDTWMSGNVTTPGWYVRSSIYETPIPAGDVWLEAGEMTSLMTDGCEASIIIPPAID